MSASATIETEPARPSVAYLSSALLVVGLLWGGTNSLMRRGAGDPPAGEGSLARIRRLATTWQVPGPTHFCTLFLRVWITDVVDWPFFYYRFRFICTAVACYLRIVKGNEAQGGQDPRRFV
jgi:hypothetical protein